VASKKQSSKTTMTIKEAARYLDVGEQYIRLLIRNGTFETQLNPISEGAHVSRHEIPLAEIEAFKGRTARHFGRREDGRNKFVVYLSPEEHVKITKLLEETMPQVVSLLVRASTRYESNGSGDEDEE
jgi:hypothetical protein